MGLVHWLLWDTTSVATGVVHLLRHGAFARLSGLEKFSNPILMPIHQNDRLPETEELFSKQAATEGWHQIINPTTDKWGARLSFTRVTTNNGPVIDHALFLHIGREKVAGVCQFGEDAQGPIGWAHGGASATMHDAITGILAREYSGERVVTGNLSISFKNPAPMRAAILMEATIEKREGRKIFLRGSLKSADGKITYSQSTAIFIILSNTLGEMSKL